MGTARRKTVHIKFVESPDGAKELHEAAARAGITASEFIRRAIRQALAVERARRRIDRRGRPLVMPSVVDA